MMKLFEMKFGSHLYGTDTPNSDLDLKSIYLPTAREIVLGNYKKTISTQRKKGENERNTKDDVDIEIFSFDRYLELLCEGQTVALDIFFGVKDTHPVNWYSTWIWNEIQKNKDKLLCKDVTTFMGYAKQQASRYGVKGSRMDALKRTIEMLDTFHLHTELGHYETEIKKLVDETNDLVSIEKTPLIQIVHLLGVDKKTNVPHLEVCGRKLPFGASVKFAKDVCQKIYDGYGQRAFKAHLDGGKDFKALSHAVRVNAQGLELLKTGHITFPRPEAPLLLKIKKNEMPFDEISEIIEQGLVDLNEAAKVSTLRDKPDLEWIDNFVANIYTDIVKDNQYIFKDWTAEKYFFEQSEKEACFFQKGVRK